MAKDVVINVKINNTAGVRSIGEVGKAATTTLNTLEGLEVAAELLNEQLRKLPQGSKEFNEMAQQLRIVNTELKNADLAMEVLDNEQLGSSIKGAAGGLADIAGGLTLIGVSGEGVEKIAQTFAEIEGLSKIIGGAFDVWNEGLKLIKTGQTAAAAASATLTATTATQASVTKGAVVQQRLLNAVMNANPVMLLVGAVTLLVGAFALYTKFSGDAAKAEEKRQAEEKKSIELAKAKKKVQDEDSKQIAQQSTAFVGLIYQLKETNKNSKERKDLITQINKQYGTTLKNLSDETEFQNQLNQEVKQYIAFQTLKVRLQRSDKFTTELINKQRKAQLENDKVLASIEERYGLVKTAQNEWTSTFDGEKVNLAQLRDRFQDLGDELTKNETIIFDTEDALTGLGRTSNQIKKEIADITNEGEKYGEVTASNTDKTNEFADALKALEDKVKSLQKLDEEETAKTEEDKLNIKKKVAEDELKILYDVAKSKAKNQDDETKAFVKYEEGLKLIESDYLRDVRVLREKELADMAKLTIKVNQHTQEEISAMMQKSLEDRRREYEASLELQKINGKDSIKAQTDYLKRRMQLDLQNTELTEKEKLLIIAQTQEQIDQLREDALDKTIADFQTAFQALADGFSGGDFDSINNAFNAFNTTVANLVKNFQDLSKQWSELTSPDKVASIAAMAGAVGSAVSAVVNSTQNAKIQETLGENLQAITDEENALKSSLTNRLISQEEYDQATAQLNQQKDELAKAAARKQFENDKKNAIAQAAINGAIAALKSYAQFGFPLGLIPAGIIAGITGVQIGLINGKNFTAARGGVVPGNGPSNIDSVPAMLAPGEVVLNAQASSAFLPMLSAMNESTGGIPLASGLNQNATTQIIKVYDENKNSNRPIQAYITDTQARDAIKNLNRKENRGKMFQ